MTTTSERQREPIDCRTAVQQLWDYLDQELDATRMAQVTEHVARCAECAEHVQFARTFLSALSASRSDVPDAQALQSRVVEALQREGFSSR